MNKMQMDAPLWGGTPARFFVKTQYVARPPAPWGWAIYTEDRPEPVRCSTRRYRTAEEAWAVGHTMLERLPKSAINTLT